MGLIHQKHRFFIADDIISCDLINIIAFYPYQQVNKSNISHIAEIFPQDRSLIAATPQCAILDDSHFVLFFRTAVLPLRSWEGHARAAGKRICSAGTLTLHQPHKTFSVSNLVPDSLVSKAGPITPQIPNYITSKKSENVSIQKRSRLPWPRQWSSCSPPWRQMITNERVNRWDPLERTWVLDPQMLRGFQAHVNTKHFHCSSLKTFRVTITSVDPMEFPKQDND